MSYANDPMGAALDRHITGNWGDDQFKGEEDYADFLDNCCRECIFQNCCAFSFDEEGECLVIRGIIDKQNQEMFEAEQAREAQESVEDYDDYPGGFYYAGNFSLDAPVFTGGIDYRKEDDDEMDASFFNDTCGR
jgi:hypothetical protein